jgi:predicted SAM-dependent methyltransferase
MTKLHLGCWKREIPGFVNVDLCDLPHIHFNSSIDDLHFISDSSVELIYCSHSLEYFDYNGVQNCLKEWKRVLVGGGTLRLAVPDFDKLIEVYLATGKNISKIIGPLFGRMELNTKSSKDFIFHKSIFNLDSLKKTLMDAGFDSVEKWDWRQTEHSEVDDHSQAYYPHMDKENGILISLNVQCKKPS